MYHLLLVALGGAIGSSFRHLVNLGSLRLLGPNFPWGTVAVNVVGSFLMGVFVELLADRHGGRLRAVKHQPMVADEVRIDGRRVALVRPTTYMNDSGLAVKAAMRRFGVDDVQSLVVVHDELDLPVGRIRVLMRSTCQGASACERYRYL